VRLIEAVGRVQPNVVVVLLNGSAVAMPWAERVKGIVESWLGGQAGGGAIADVLTGRVNPSGKLSETFPVDLEQTPTFPNFPSHSGHASYGEGIFVGYRYYDKKRLQPLFPFGFGLSYTRFIYTAIQTSAATFDADGMGELTVEVKVKNTGRVAGKETVQLYVRERKPRVARPEHELRAFAKVALQPGEEQTVCFALTRRDFAFYDVATHAWDVNAGMFDVLVGGSSRELPLQAAIDVHATQHPAKTLTRESMIKDFRDHPNGEIIYAELVRAMGFGDLLKTADALLTANQTPEQIAAQRKADAAVLVFVNEMPVNKIPAFSWGKFSDVRLAEILRDTAGSRRGGRREDDS